MRFLRDWFALAFALLHILLPTKKIFCQQKGLNSYVEHFADNAPKPIRNMSLQSISHSHSHSHWLYPEDMAFLSKAICICYFNFN